MECPVCGLINPPNSSQCDCGYDFQKQAGGRRQRVLGFSPVAPSLWFAWLIITAGDFATLQGSGYTDRWNYFPNALFNLFTPILFGNLIKKSVLIVTLPILFVGLFVGDWVGKQIKFTSFRVAYNLLFLLVITAAVDVITWGSPKSIENAVEAYHCVVIRPKPPWCVR
jgi:hypothetical protein